MWTNLTFYPVIKQMLSSGKPTKFPDAFKYSWVRELKNSEDRKEKLINPVVLCEEPWLALKTEHDELLKSCIKDSAIYCMKTFVLLFLFYQ